MLTTAKRTMGGLVLPCALALLAACSGTIRPDTRVQGDAARVDGIAQVSAVLSADAQKQLADNPQFNRDELAGTMRRRLEGKGLLASGATHRIEIVVTDLRVRGTFSAVMFGFMAGDDHVVGRVRVLDSRNQPVRSFNVQASYAFGGWAGADGMRMNWLYDKFSELAVAELEKVVRVPSAGTAPSLAPADSLAAAAVAVPVAANPPMGAAPTARVALASGGAAIDQVDVIPGLNEYGRNMYRDWLTRRPPRAFVITSDGRSNATWGTRPKNPADPADPAERALKQCRDGGRPGCTLYAVDDRVVYAPAAPASAALP